MRELINRLRDSAPILILGITIGVCAAYIGMTAYLEHVIDQRIDASGLRDVVAKDDRLPGGALQFFDRPEGCPAGWTDQGATEPDLFAGRMLVAVGTHTKRTARAYREVGGSEFHTLTSAEMPPHVHGVISAHEFLWLQQAALAKGATMAEAAQLTFIKPFNPETDLEDCRDCGPDYKMTALSTTATGGRESGKEQTAAPHNIMPPFVAMYLCRKE